jgi:hypothetical protein
VKKSCEDVAKSLVHELDGRFPNHDLMLALGVICPNFLVDHPNDAQDVFHQHSIVIKVPFFMPHKVGK